MRSLAEQQQIGGMYCATYDELKKDKSRILDFMTSYREFTLDTEQILNDHDTSNTKKYQSVGAQSRNEKVVDRQNYKRYPVGNQVNMELEKLNSYENLRYSGREN